MPIHSRVAAAAVPGPHAAAAVEAAAAAEPVDPRTELLQPPDVTGAIFVDGSGRRGRRLRTVTYALVVLALALVLAFWVMQGVDVFGSSA